VTTFTLQRHHRLRALAYVIVPVIGALFVVEWLLYSLSPQPMAPALVWPGVVFLAWGLLWLFVALRKPYRATVHDDGDVEFEALLGRWRVPVSDVRWVKGLVYELVEVQDGWLQRLFRCRPLFTYGFLLRHTHGWVWLWAHRQEMYEFINALQALNPGIEAVVWRQRLWTRAFEPEAIHPQPEHAPHAPIFRPRDTPPSP
jgi:hypothetical protein